MPIVNFQMKSMKSIPWEITDILLGVAHRKPSPAGFQQEDFYDVHTNFTPFPMQD